MELDNIGKLLRTNRVEITPNIVKKTYCDFSPTMIWGVLERKPYMSAKQRYLREKKLIPKLYDSGLNTPELISFNDHSLELNLKTLELTDLVEIFQDQRISKLDKLDYFKQALEQLYGIHNLGETHGDPYLKNFFRLNDSDKQGKNIYTCDFEYLRNSPNPQVTDILILFADATHLIKKYHPEETLATFDLLQEVYGANFSFPFDIRDRFFFKARFEMKSDFFKYFN